MNVGPDALKWSWLLLVLGGLLFADGFFNWGMLTSQKRRAGEPPVRYGSFGRALRMFFGGWLALVGAAGLVYLTML